MEQAKNIPPRTVVAAPSFEHQQFDEPLEFSNSDESQVGKRRQCQSQQCPILPAGFKLPSLAVAVPLHIIPLKGTIFVIPQVDPLQLSALTSHRRHRHQPSHLASNSTVLVCDSQDVSGNSAELL
jgi:hypothetical protein